MVEAVGGGLLGMAGVKMIPGFLPGSLTSIGGSYAPILVSLASAFGLKWVAEKIRRGGFSDAVFFGALIQTGSTALSIIAPGAFSVLGLGDLTPARFPVPQNPIRAALRAGGGAMVAGGTTPSMNMSGFERAYGRGAY